MCSSTFNSFFSLINSHCSKLWISPLLLIYSFIFKSNILTWQNYLSLSFSSSKKPIAKKKIHESNTIFLVFVRLSSLALKKVGSNTIYSIIYLHYPKTVLISSDCHRSFWVKRYPGFENQTFHYVASPESASTNTLSVNKVNLSGVTGGMTGKFKG